MSNIFYEFYEEPRNKQVRKANTLIEKSSFDLSLQQQKIVLYLISQITPFDKEFKTYQFDIKSFCKVCGIDYKSGTNYAEIKHQIKEIRNKSKWITLRENGEEVETLISWIETAKIRKKSGVIEIRLNEELKPYLLQLYKNFTAYDIIFILCFKGKYTIRFYELIKCIHYNELEKYERIFTLEEFKKLVGAEKYKTYQDIKVRVLEKAIAEVNEISDKIVSYTPIKEGKKVTALKLTIETKNNVELAKIRADLERRFNPSRQISLFEED